MKAFRQLLREEMSFNLWTQFNISLITWIGLQILIMFPPCRIFCSAERQPKRLWRQELKSETRIKGWPSKIIRKYCQAPGLVQCPGQGPVSSPWSRSRSELRSSKFSVKFSKERTWRDTIIKQTTTTTPPPANFLKLLP